MTIDLRTVTTGILLMAGASVAMAATLEVPSVWPKGSTWYADLELAAADIAESTEGRVEIVLEKANALESIPELAVYTMPLLFRDEEELVHVREKLDTHLMEIFAERGQVIWDLQTIGTAHLFSKLPLTTLDQFLESRVWVPKDSHDVKYDEVGLKHPVPLDLRLLRDGLRKDEIDTFTLTPTAALLKRYHTRVAVVSRQPIVYVVAPLSVSQEALAQFSPEDQALVREKLVPAFQRAARTNMEKDQDAMGLFDEREGLNVSDEIDYNDASWQDWAENVRNRLVASETIPGDIYEKVKTILAEYRAAQG